MVLETINNIVFIFNSYLIITTQSWMNTRKGDKCRILS